MGTATYTVHCSWMTLVIFVGREHDHLYPLWGDTRLLLENVTSLSFNAENATFRLVLQLFFVLSILTGEQNRNTKCPTVFFLELGEIQVHKRSFLSQVVGHRRRSSTNATQWKRKYYFSSAWAALEKILIQPVVLHNTWERASKYHPETLCWPSSPALH